MKIKITDQVVGLIFETKYEKTVYSDAFTYSDISKAYGKNGFDAKKIEKIKLMKIKDNCGFLFSGFLKQVIEKAKEENIKITEVKDERTKFPHQSKNYTNKELEKYFPFNYVEHQTEALKRLLKINNGIIKMQTGSGKAEVIFAYIKETNLPTLILIDKVTLASQLRNRAEEFGIKNVGIWHGKEKIPGDVVFATIRSVGSYPSLNKFKVLILDEIHHTSSESFQAFLKKCLYPIRIGFSATPDKGDKYLFAKICQFMGDVIFETDAETLIDNKVIAKPKIYFVEVFCPQTIDWPSAYQKCIIDNKERNKKIVDIVNNFEKPTLVLIKDVKYQQGEIIKEAIQKDSNKSVEYIHGSSKNDRIKIIEDFENGNLDVLISTNILNEGVSIKNIELLINASGGKSKVENLQKIGRGTRITKTKDTVTIIDFDDIGNSFTAKHSEMRKELYIKEGFTDINSYEPEGE